MVKQVIAFYIVNKYSNIDWLNSERGLAIAANFVTISNQLFSVYSIIHDTVLYFQHYIFYFARFPSIKTNSGSI